MTQQEFETLTGLTVTTTEYAYIERVYKASSFQKAEFCKEWKKNHSLATSNLVCDLVMEIETLRGSYETLQKEYLRRRFGFGFGLWEEDKKALTEILTAE